VDVAFVKRVIAILRIHEMVFVIHNLQKTRFSGVLICFLDKKTADYQKNIGWL
jgi:hypothetical protein